MMRIYDEALKAHDKWKGKIEITGRAKVGNRDDLSLAYTPGVASPCLEIQRDPDLSYTYTRRWNMVAVITDGTAVLGLGDIGPLGAMPVMEGKCVLFKTFADVDAFPICIDSKDTDEIVNTILRIHKSFGGINLEDISAPRCFEIERRLMEQCDIPIFHDDQHGTAVVTLAALINSLKLTKRKLKDVYAVVNGAGAAGIAIARLLMEAGLKDLVLCDRLGAIYSGRADLNREKEMIAQSTNPKDRRGTLGDVIKGAHLFVGVSAPHILTKEMVAAMASDPIVFAMANPVPEIMPQDAKDAGARVVGTGRSDFPNQINNVLVFPGIFRGAFDVRASEINNEMKIAAAYAIAGLVEDHELTGEYIIADPFDKRVANAVAKAVAQAAVKSGVARM